MMREAIPNQPALPEGYYYHPEGYLWFVLPVERFGRLPTHVNVDEYALDKKSEFHVTVINARKVARDIAALDAARDPIEIEKHLLSLLAEHVKKQPIEFVRFEDDLRLAKSPDRISIAARCLMRGIEEYFRAIQTNYNYLPPAQPTHVSLYTLPGRGAVGIDTKEEMESFKKVDVPSVQSVLNTVPGFAPKF